MRKVLGLVVCLALTGSIASAFTYDVKLADLRESASKTSTPAYMIVPVVGGNGGELFYTVNFTAHRQGTVTAFVDVSNKDYDAVKRHGGHIEVRLYAGDDRGHMKRLRSQNMKHDDKKNIEFRADEVCNDFGTYDRYLKIWASARLSNGKPMPDYTSDNRGKSVKVTCHSYFWSGFTFID